MKTFVVISLIWYIFIFITNILSVGIAVGEDDRETGLSALFRIIVCVFFIIGASIALIWG